MTQDIYGQVHNKTNLRDVYKQIRDDVAAAGSREALTELHRRAGYLVTLTHSPSWREKFGDQAEEIREVAQEQFGTTARKVNARAREIRTEANYAETWGGN